MAIQHWSDEIIIVDLPQEPNTSDELAALTEYVSEKENYNVVVDFAGVENITSSNLSRLLQLQQLTADGGRRLVLCNVDPATEDILSVTGLSEVFELTCDKFTALATLEMIG